MESKVKKRGNPNIAEAGEKTRIKKGDKKIPSLGGQALVAKIEKARNFAETWNAIRELPADTISPNGQSISTTIEGATVMSQAVRAIGGDIQAAKFLFGLEDKVINVSPTAKGLQFVIQGDVKQWTDIVNE